ncbi:MAG: molybdopterin-containing oxidoreductase family protein, partial [Bacillota bacterium]
MPSTCLQCVSVCGIIGYVENNRLVKIEGNPAHPNSRGRICAKGQAGVNQAYDPDRILYPMKRAGNRGEGKWIRISWNDALNEVATKLKAVKDSGKPEEFIFHSGRNRTNGITDRFCNAFGTPSVFNHTAICEASKQIALDFMIAKTLDINDVANTRYMLNFGCNVYETHVIHTSFAQRVIDGRMNGAKLVTFDVRMSNTAGRSDEWVPIKPGTDGLVALAMANVIMQEGLYNKDFIENWTNVTVNQLKDHLKQYTPEMAEKESGVPATTITRIAKEFGNAKPATTISYRGVCAHYNGLMNERAVFLLNVITGNIDNQGGACMPQGGKLNKDGPAPVAPKPTAKSGIKEAWKVDFPEASHGVNQTVLPYVKAGKAKCQVYMTYVYNPVYSNPDSDLQGEILKDETLIPYFVAIDSYMSEATALADLIFPDATYLERWDPETTNSYAMFPFVSLRQPIVPPLGEAREVRDILKDLANRIGGGMEKYFAYGSTEDYIKDAVAVNTSLNWDDFKKTGVWYAADAKAKYNNHMKELTIDQLKDTKVDEKGNIYKEANGVKTYVGIKVGEKSYVGFATGAHKATAKLEVYSEDLEKHHFPGLPSYIPIPQHQAMMADQLIMTTFKVNVHTQSRTANCKWLTEIVHDNPLWIHPQTAATRGIKNGDQVVVTSEAGTIKTKVKVTEGVHPGVVSFAMGMGHWEYGRIAQGSGKFTSTDSDTKRVWWKGTGVHLNPIIPVRPDPIGGNQAWM